MEQSKKQILVADDNALSRSLVRYYLKSLNCAVHETETGEESILEMMNHEVDLLILDWNMPNLNGYDTLLLGDQMMKFSIANNKKIPVIIYTNVNLMDLDLPECSYFNIKATISKKLTPFQQLQKIKKTLRRLPNS